MSQRHPFSISGTLRPRARWLLAILLSSCSVHEHELTPYEKGGRGGTAGSPGSGGTAGVGIGGAAGTMQGGAAGSGGPSDGSAGTGDAFDVAVDESSVSDGPSPEDGSTCLPDCPPTACGSISNNCGATLSCGPCRLDSTFTPVAGVNLTTPRYAAASVRIGNYAYVIGGINSGTYLSTVERATVDVNGNLSNFSDAGVTLVLPRSGHTALFVNQQLYVIGGLSISYTPTVERSTVDGNGNLGPFVTVSGVTLTTARGAHGTTVIGHNDYIIGGNFESALDSIESATFSSNGDLSTFTPVAGIALTTKRLGFANVNVGHWLYVIGGATDIVADAGASFGYLSSFERAPFDRGGLAGTFAALPSVSLAVPRYKLAAFAFGTTLYAIGGTNNTSGSLTSVEQGTINANGDVTGPFAVSNTIALTTPRAGAVFVVAPPWLYAIGGFGGAPGYLNTVERAGVQ